MGYRTTHDASCSKLHDSSVIVTETKLNENPNLKKMSLIEIYAKSTKSWDLGQSDLVFTNGSSRNIYIPINHEWECVKKKT
jgi:hypothetical protein